MIQVIPFESSRKWAGIVMKIPNGFRLYVKGAAEIIFKNCGFENNINDELIKLDRSKRDDVLSKIDEYANDALRAIALAHRDFVGISSWPPSELSSSSENKKTTTTAKEADPAKLINTSSSASEIHKMFILDALVGIQDPLKRELLKPYYNVNVQESLFVWSPGIISILLNPLVKNVIFLPWMIYQMNIHVWKDHNLENYLFKKTRNCTSIESFSKIITRR